MPDINTPSWRQSLTATCGRWRDRLEALLLPETEGLGVLVDKAGLILAQVGKNQGRFQIRQVSALPLAAGNLEDLAPQLKDLVASWGLKGCPAGLAVASHLSFLRQVTLPRAAAENLAQVVTYELDRFVPLPPDQVYHGYQVQNTTESGIDLLVMALRRDWVAACLDLLREAGLRPVSLTPAPLAAANAFALLANRRLPANWLMLHLEPGAFELTDIRQGVVKSFRQARELKSRAILDELAAAIPRLAAAGDRPPAMCVYGAGDGDLPARGWQQHDFTIIYPGQIGLPPSPAAAAQDSILPAVGAGLACIAKPPIKINLLPPEERSTLQADNTRSAPLILLKIFLCLALIWAGSALIHQRVLLYRVNREIARLTPETREMEKLLTESRQLAKQMEGMRQIGQALDTLQLLKKLTQLVPDNTSLFNLRLSKENLEISGLSQSASELIPRLEKSGWLTKTEFASPIVTDANKLDHFKITAKVKALAPLPGGEAAPGTPAAGLAAHGGPGPAADLPGSGESAPEPDGQLEPGIGPEEPGPGQVPGPGGQQSQVN